MFTFTFVNVGAGENIGTREADVTCTSVSPIVVGTCCVDIPTVSGVVAFIDVGASRSISLSVTSVSFVTGASVSNGIYKSVVVGAYSVIVAWATVAFVDIGTFGFLIIGVCKSVFALTDAAGAGSETDAIGGG
jgi:hypothetical protein